MADIELQPIRVGTGSRDNEGRLAVANGELVAVLVRLDDPIHASACGAWFLEAGFGPSVDAKGGAIFNDLDQASEWLRERVKG